MDRTPWITEDGKKIVWATHPDKPSKSTKARGRKLHIQRSEGLTWCHMLPVYPALKWRDQYRNLCKSCAANLADWRAKQ